MDPPARWPAARSTPRPERLALPVETLPGVGPALRRKLGRLGYRAVNEPGARLVQGEYRTRMAVVEFVERASPAPIAKQAAMAR